MAIRCLHEASLQEANSFVTLTYAPERLRSWSLHYKDFQDFMKRLRHVKPGVRFFMCGEYGEEHQRPHFHALLFGAQFADQKHLKRLPDGSSLFRSEELDTVWSHGNTSIGAVTMQSAQYVARYAEKSLVAGSNHWQRTNVTNIVDAETGETWIKVPEFVRMSNGGGRGSEKRGGIGKQWFEQFHTDVYGRQDEPKLDRVVIGGAEGKPPKYYDELLRRQSEYRLEYVKFVRELEALRRGDSELTPGRLKVRETCVRARLLQKKRD